MSVFFTKKKPTFSEDLNLNCSYNFKNADTAFAASFSYNSCNQKHVGDIQDALLCDDCSLSECF